MRWPWSSVIRLESTLPKCGCWAPEWMLPSVSPEERGLDCLRLGRVDRTAAFRCEVAGVGFDLKLQDAIHRGDQFHEVIDAPVALLRGQPGIVTYPLELVDDRVLAFLLPVLEEHVLEQLGEIGVGIDAPAIVFRHVTSAATAMQRGLPAWQLGIPACRASHRVRTQAPPATNGASLRARKTA